nr:uncharacterized protein LOC112748696 [Arachis hypogaea]
MIRSGGDIPSEPDTPSDTSEVEEDAHEEETPTQAAQARPEQAAPQQGEPHQLQATDPEIPIQSEPPLQQTDPPTLIQQNVRDVIEDMEASLKSQEEQMRQLAHFVDEPTNVFPWPGEEYHAISLISREVLNEGENEELVEQAKDIPVPSEPPFQEVFDKEDTPTIPQHPSFENK